ncbi:MAG: hypothetical protein J6Z01_05610 [Bacteroidales bacterium]|nr:hypothetical protein [Bacteroidales bacterium]
MALQLNNYTNGLLEYLIATLTKIAKDPVLVTNAIKEANFALAKKYLEHQAELFRFVQDLDTERWQLYEERKTSKNE